MEKNESGRNVLLDYESHDFSEHCQTLLYDHAADVTPGHERESVPGYLILSESTGWQESVPGVGWQYRLGERGVLCWYEL